MNVPAWMHDRVSEIIGIEMNRATSEEDTARKSNLWAVILGLKPTLDGNQWCFLYGDNLQTGVAGFGRSVVEAMANFERAMEERQAS